MFPLELFNLISLHCKPYLFSVNKELHLLYNDEWFQNKLQTLFPGRKLFTISNYKNLYRRYLSETDIYYIAYDKRLTYDEISNISLDNHYKLITKGVKAQHCGTWTSGKSNKYDHILTFNGELYLETDNEIKLIDTEVIDISTNLYIKDNGVYYIFEGCYNKHDNTVTGCKQIIYNCYAIWVLTENGVVSINDDQTEFYPINNCVKMFLHICDMYVFDSDNNMYCISFGKLSKLDYTLDLSNRTKVKLSDENIINVYYDDDYNWSLRIYY